MILKLNIECAEGRYLNDQCIRIIAIDDSASLRDLHEAIQNAVSFDQDHLYTFYTANSASPRAKRDWFTLNEDWDEMERIFRDTKLSGIWPLGRKKLYYYFDFGDTWIFEIKKMRHCQKDDAISCPQVLERIGPDPEQYPIFEE